MKDGVGKREQHSLRFVQRSMAAGAQLFGVDGADTRHVAESVVDMQVCTFEEASKLWSGPVHFETDGFTVCDANTSLIEAGLRPFEGEVDSPETETALTRAAHAVLCRELGVVDLVVPLRPTVRRITAEDREDGMYLAHVDFPRSTLGELVEPWWGRWQKFIRDAVPGVTSVEDLCRGYDLCGVRTVWFALSPGGTKGQHLALAAASSVDPSNDLVRYTVGGKPGAQRRDSVGVLPGGGLRWCLPEGLPWGSALVFDTLRVPHSAVDQGAGSPTAIAQEDTVLLRQSAEVRCLLLRPRGAQAPPRPGHVS